MEIYDDGLLLSYEQNQGKKKKEKSGFRSKERKLPILLQGSNSYSRLSSTDVLN